MTGTELGILAAIFSFVGLSAFVSMSETALVRLSRVKALQLDEEGRRGARSLSRLLEDPPRFLNVILLVNTIGNLAGTALATLLAARLTGDWAAVVSTAAMTILIFVFAESGPKTYAVQNSERVALRVAPVISWLVRLPGLHLIVRGLVRVANFIIPGKGLPHGPFVTEEEIRTMAAVAADEEAIEKEEKEMIHSIFEFGDTVVREVMVPRPDMVAVPAGAALKEVLDLMLKRGYSRVPVYAGTVDEIVGVVYAKDVIRRLHRNGNRGRSTRAKDLMRPAVFVPDSKKVAELLREMQAGKTHMAIVVDEYGDVAGLVTIEDLLEEIVGEIADEYDREEPQVQPVDDRTIRVAGRMPIDQLSELLDVDLPDTEWDTVGGLMAGLLGKVPRARDEVAFLGLHFRAEKVKGRRLATVLITRATSRPLQADEPGR